MSKQEDYLRAVALAKAGKLEEAQGLLLTIDHPKAELLLEKVNKAIAARGTAKQPVEKQKPKQGLHPAIPSLLIIVLVAVGIAAVFYYQGVYLPQSKSNRERAANIYCHGYFAVEAIDISREAFDRACEKTAKDAVLVYDKQIDYCLSQSQNGDLTQSLVNCMEEQIPYLPPTHIQAAK